MSKSVNVSAFISSSSFYVKSSIFGANTNGNAYLTKTEGKKLPKDLQDNFENHRFGAQDNASVSVKKFATNYVKYVAINAREADANNNGILSIKEAKSLPRDLQDNFKNYRAGLQDYSIWA